MNEELRIKLKELESLLLIVSRGLETSEESFKAKDVSNMISIIHKEIQEIVSKID